MGRPNFLIVGAPKAGTTSLCKYLSQHPDIYIPDKKELRFFIREEIRNINKKDPLLKGILKSSCLSEKEYFQKFSNKYKMNGEASVQYLYYYKTAIKNIKKYLGDIPIIIILRNPIDRTISNWLYLSYENLTFREALVNENARIKNNYNSFWFYLNQSLYYDQIKAYKENFTKVKVILFEEFKNNTLKVLNEIKYFLGVAGFDKFEINKIYNPTIDYYLPRSVFIRKLADKYYFRLLNDYVSKSEKGPLLLPMRL